MGRELRDSRRQWCYCERLSFVIRQDREWVGKGIQTDFFLDMAESLDRIGKLCLVVLLPCGRTSDRQERGESRARILLSPLLGKGGVLLETVGVVS